MELRVLRYFLAVAREESISEAAQRLHVTQPTLSRQPMDLEEGLGYTLTLGGLINTAGNSPLCFRPLEPRLELEASLVWKKYQPFSRAAELFLAELKGLFCA